MNPEHSAAPLRPRDLALLLLASRDLRPRKRARDQQADRAGLELKRRVLEQGAAVDPEPDELEAALLRIVAGLGEPSGPARAIAAVIRDDWQMSCVSPEWVGQLLSEAVEPSDRKAKESRRG